jgi:hypothetical protein
MVQNEEVIDDLFGTAPLPTLYAKTPIVWYSFLFSPFVGGVLMCINLWRLQKRGHAVLILLASFAFTLGSYYLGVLVVYKASSRLLVLLLNLAGGNALSTPVWRSLIGNRPYQKANAWLPLVFVLIGYALLGVAAYLFLIYSLNGFGD